MAARLIARTWLRAFTLSAVREWDFLRSSPWDLALVTWLPFVCLAILGWLLSGAIPRELPIAVVDDDRSALSRQLMRMLDAAPGTAVVARPASLTEAWTYVRALEAYAVVYIPRDATRDVQREGRATVFVYQNASYSTAGSAAARDVRAVVASLGADVAGGDLARQLGPQRIRPAAVLVQSSTLANPTGSYEAYLAVLLFPAVLHLACCLAAAGSFGRELRDGTIASWMEINDGATLSAVGGKLVSYLLAFSLHGCGYLVYLVCIRGYPLPGHAAILLLGQALMFAAYSAIAVLLVGATRNMGTALSLASLYAGTSIGFTGVTFPIDDASLFVRAWSAMLPFTAYVRLQSQQLYGSRWTYAMAPVATLALFVVVPGMLGLVLYGRAARDPAAWGQR